VSVVGAAATAVTAALEGAGGRPRQGPAGRRVVLFDGPATAVRAAVRHLQPGAQVGVSVAEVPRDGDRAEGHGVEAALHLADAAPPGTIWVSDTVGVLLAGSGIDLAPAGQVATPAAGDHAVLRPVAG
jgi:hypothetical protein